MGTAGTLASQRAWRPAGDSCFGLACVAGLVHAGLLLDHSEGEIFSGMGDEVQIAQGCVPTENVQILEGWERYYSTARLVTQVCSPLGEYSGRGKGNAIRL